MSKELLAWKSIEHAKPKEKEYELRDGDGLTLRIRPGGEKDWVLRYTLGGKRLRMGLGSLRDIGLADVREEADNARKLIAQCVDPKLERERRKAAVTAEREESERRKNRLTVTTLFDEWFEADVTRRSDGGKEVKRTFNKDVLPAIGTRYVNEVQRSDIITILDKVKKRGAVVLVRNLLGDIRQMFNYGLLRNLLEVDPTFGLKRDTWGKKKERDRHLKIDEISLLAVKLPSAGLKKSTVATAWLLLATGCRIGEICLTQKVNVDPTSNHLHLPGEITKNGLPHDVYLSEFAKEQLKVLYAEAPLESPFILPARRTRSDVSWKGLCYKSFSKQVTDRQHGPDSKPMKNRSKLTDALILPGGRWTAHDLRRSCATLMGQLGVAPHIIEKCLNHVDPNKMQRIYQRHSTQQEQQTAWELVGSTLSQICNTVTMEART